MNSSPDANGPEMTSLLSALTAIKEGKPGVRLPSTWSGTSGQVAKMFNEFVETNERFASEAKRVAREVAGEGKLGGQVRADAPGGALRDVADSINELTAVFAAQIRDLTAVTKAVATGDLSKKITVDAQGEVLVLKSMINTMVEQLRAFTSEVTRVAREAKAPRNSPVQVQIAGVAGSWKELAESVNSMAGGPAA
jgi:methyl-accepting chemotaxis protein